MSTEATGQPPDIPDYHLLRCIGDGSFGEVWLARSVTGAFRAVKVIRRNKFDTNRPFDREFNGVRNYEPLSRAHPGLVAILHVGRKENEGWFYYVMELADDVQRGQEIDPQVYCPRTLSEHLRARRPLPLREGYSLAISLIDGLGYLHAHGLVHRDIKPANIIFVNGVPKYADVGLVKKIGELTSEGGGTLGYFPPEGPGTPQADLYSLGKVLYEILMGKSCHCFPELPTEIGTTSDTPTLFRLNEVILKACEKNCLHRFRSALDLRVALMKAVGERVETIKEEEPSPASARRQHAGERSPPHATSAEAGTSHRKTSKVVIVSHSKIEPDSTVLDLLRNRLRGLGFHVFVDEHLAIGMEWARDIERAVREADAVIALLSPRSIENEMIAYQVETAWQASEQQDGRPCLMPVRLGLREALPGTLSRILGPLRHFIWESAQDNERLVAEMVRALEGTPTIAQAARAQSLESVGGAVPLDSRFYVVRPTDREFQCAISRGDSVVLVKGARQMGKTSLLARGLQTARESGAQVALTDFQKLNSEDIASIDAFFLALGEFLADQLGMSNLPESAWDKRRSANTNFERYMRREVLDKIPGHLVWGLDEVDRLFTTTFGSEVFGLLRSWHNERALDPGGPWSRLTLAMAYATEAHLFITDVNQSPFNVGTRLALSDFTVEQVRDLNVRYGRVLSSDAELARLCSLLGGQPYLVRRAFHELASGHVSLDELIAQADHDEGIFGDHLRRILVLLAKDAELLEMVRGIIRGQPCASLTSFYRLRSAGLLAGESPDEARLRCPIYAAYLKRHLL